MSDDMYQEVETGELFKWKEVGATVEGILTSYEEKATSKGQGHVYEVRNKNNEVVPFFAPSLLHGKLKGIAIGQIVKITFTEITKTGGGNDLKHFKVLHAEPTEANLKVVGIEVLKEASADEIIEGEQSADDVPFGGPSQE